MAEKEKLAEKVKELRDEIKLHKHLLKMELKDQWDELEKKWSDVDQKLKAAKKSAAKAEAHIEAAGGLVLEELWDGYDKLKKALRKLKK